VSVPSALAASINGPRSAPEALPEGATDPLDAGGATEAVEADGDVAPPLEQAETMKAKIASGVNAFVSARGLVNVVLLLVC
jgi:hypothetical protein